MGTGLFLGVKLPGRGFDHARPSSAEVKERVEPYLFSPSGYLWPVVGQNLPSFFAFIRRTSGENLETFEKSKAISGIGEHWAVKQCHVESCLVVLIQYDGVLDCCSAYFYK